MAGSMDAVDSRVARMPTELRQRLLARAGIELDAKGASVPAEGQGEQMQQCRWGFPTNLPPRQRLVDLLQQQQAAAEEVAAAGAQQAGLHQRQSGGQGRGAASPARAPPGGPTERAQPRPVLLELLQQSRTFQSPDCADAMAEALGVADLHRGLRGSLLFDAPSEAAVQHTRALLRAELRGAWSREALRRGVALAKAGDLGGALPCYDQALQLDAGNADALVARGAALANRRQWQRAADDLAAALQLQPQHSNAQLYLDAVQSKAAEAGVRLEPPGEGGQRSGLAGPHANGERAQRAQRAPPSPAQQAQQARPQRLDGKPAAEAAGGDGERRNHGAAAGAADDRGRQQGDVQGRQPADGRGRKRRRGSRSRSRSRGTGLRGQDSRDSSRSPRRRRRSTSPSSGSSGSSSRDSDADATAERLAQAQQRLQQPGSGEAAAGPEGLLGAGMDVATALQIVASHYKSRRGKEGKEKKRRRHRAEGGKRHKHRQKKKHKKKHRH